MDFLKKLHEQRDAAQAKMQKILDSAKMEERAMSEDESKQFDDLEKEIRALDKTIEAEERAAKVKTPVAPVVENRAEVEERAFADLIRGKVENRADFTFSDNGAVVPASIVKKIIKKVYDLSPILASSTKYNVKGTVNVPYYDENEGTITVAYAEEFTDLTESSGKFKSIQLKGFLAGALAKVSESLVNNSDFDIVGFIENDMAEKIARWLEGELIKGTNEKIDGLSKVTQIITAAAAEAVTADELIDVQEAVPDQFQANAYWIMNRATRTAIRKLKDKDGNYILNKDATSKWGYTLFGKDVYTSENAPKMQTGKKAVYYGDFSGLATKISEDINVKVLREKYATQHCIGVVGYVEADAKIENTQKIAALQMA